MELFISLVCPLLWWGLNGWNAECWKVVSADTLKRNRNYISATNSAVSVIGGCWYLWTNQYLPFYSVCEFSYAYFLWDTFLMLFFQLPGSSVFIYHHLVSLFFIYLMSNSVPMVEREWYMMVYVIAEASNLPYYYVYDWIHRPDSPLKQKVLFRWKWVQAVWYGFWRCIGLGCLFPVMWSVVDSVCLKVNAIVLYTMGLYWSYVQFLLVIRETKTYKKQR